ncbi:MAG TPA: hypothetical protein V6D26_16975 [Stenomitos sp.]
MLKLKLSLLAILSTTAIASGMVLSSVSSVQSCLPSQSEVYQPEGYEQSPWVAMITLPGIALAAVLSAGNRWYQKN